MIILDANLLIYAVNQDAPLHRKAKLWLELVLSGRQTVGLPWNVLLAFLRLTTKPGLFQRPLSLEAALDLLARWLDEPTVVIVHPGPRHLSILRDLLLPLGTGGNLTSDAHLAAVAIEHGAELCSSDTDFARYPRLNWHNPLA
ncbi:MAG: type II toxin-antitoxin system VapC family toxin [Bryobacterales bacterium]|nr:type II toxin-antitoxin system VapC family toxin [Bryobacterales bacterium]